MKPTVARTALALALAAAGTDALAQSLNVVCSMNPQWCRNAAAIFERTQGVKMNVINKPTGESFAQIVAEKERPKLDGRFGGTADPHLQAAEMGLLAEYKSPQLPQLHAWAQATSAASKVAATSGSYQFPSHKATPVPGGAPKLKGAKLIDYDLQKYGAAAERKRLIAKWEAEILNAK